MTDDWWDSPPLTPAVTDWDDQVPRREPSLQPREAGVAARRGVTIAIGLIAIVAGAGILLSAIAAQGAPHEPSGSGFLVLAPAATDQPSVVAPTASPTIDRTQTPQPDPTRQSSTPTEHPVPGVRATLIRVVDGDTIHALVDGFDETIRIIGLDSPESHRPGTPVECLALESTAAAEFLLVPGDAIVLQSDHTQDDRDRYDRLLAHVFLVNGDLFAERMIEGGWAIHYIYDATPSVYADRLAAAQERAVATEAGIWATDTCNGDPHAATAAP